MKRTSFMVFWPSLLLSCLIISCCLKTSSCLHVGLETTTVNTPCSTLTGSVFFEIFSPTTSFHKTIAVFWLTPFFNQCLSRKVLIVVFSFSNFVPGVLFCCWDYLYQFHVFQHQLNLCL